MSHSPNENIKPSNELSETPSDLSRTLGFIIGFFGIYFLVIGLFSLLAILVLKNTSAGAGAMSDKDIYALILTVTSIVLSLAAMFIGFKLIKRQDSGRKLFNIYAVIAMLISFAQYTYSQQLIAKSYSNMPAELAAAARGSESAASFTVFIFPTVLIVLGILLNWRNIRNWFKP